VAAFYVFGTGQDWWGALPDLPPLALTALAAGGIFIAQRVNKITLVLAFLGTYYTLFTIAAFVGDPARVAEVFRPPDLNAVLYFVCFMLTDPPTAPTRQDDQIKCGVLVAITSFAAFEWLGAVCYLLIGLLIGNLWEAWRRRSIAAHRRAGDRRSDRRRGRLPPSREATADHRSLAEVVSRPDPRLGALADQ